MANPLTDAAKNAMLDLSGNWPPNQVSLHTGDPGTNGANEVAGGSPAYARKTPAWGAAASGAKPLSGSLTFDVPVGTTVRWYGLWHTSGPTFLGHVPAGSGARRAFSVPDTTVDTLESPAHGLVNNDVVVVYAAVGAALPTGLSEGTPYFVVNATTDDFQLSTTQGGGAINLTTIGDGEVQKMTPEGPYGAQGQYVLNALSLSLPG